MSNRRSQLSLSSKQKINFIKEFGPLKRDFITFVKCFSKKKSYLLRSNSEKSDFINILAQLCGIDTKVRLMLHSAFSAKML